MIFLGARFCSHCGGRIVQTTPALTNAPCPRCHAPLQKLQLAGQELNECSKCHGVWASTQAVEGIYADREKQSSILGSAAVVGAEKVTIEHRIRYLPCPVCRKLMNRVNFAKCSSVIVDICKSHGTWFDQDELRRIVEFIRGGGLELAKERELAALEERQRRARAANVADRFSSASASGNLSVLDWADPISEVAAVLGDFLGGT